MSEVQHPDRVSPIGTLWVEPEGFHSDITLIGGDPHREALRDLGGSITKTPAQAEAAMGRLCERLNASGLLDRRSEAARFYLGKPSPTVVTLSVVDNTPEIPVAVCEEVSSWRRIMHNTSRDGAWAQLTRAARNLFHVLLIVKTNEPKAHRVARIHVVDALNEFASFHEIDADNAQRLFVEAQALVALGCVEPSKSEAEIVGARRTSEPLRPLHLPEFLELKVPPRRLILSPWLPEKGAAMVYALKGVGKTLLGLGVAHAVATGGGFLGWSVPEPRRVLYIDGEMPAADMQERLRAILGGESASANFRMLCGDLTERGLPDLATREGQRAFDNAVGDADLIILDNISTLCRSGKENEAEAWQTVQDWTLGHRRAGRSTIFLHHAGRGGNQRGTSKREDVLDSMIALRHPSDYTPGQGARFEVHFEKHRSFHGADAEPFEAKYEERGGVGMWTRAAIADVDLKRVIEALEEGATIRDAAKDLGMSKSKVDRLKTVARERGLLDD